MVSLITLVSANKKTHMISLTNEKASLTNVLVTSAPGGWVSGNINQHYVMSAAVWALVSSNQADAERINQQLNIFKYYNFILL